MVLHYKLEIGKWSIKWTCKCCDYIVQINHYIIIKITYDNRDNLRAYQCYKMI